MTPEQAQHEIHRLTRSFKVDLEPDFAGFLAVNDVIEELVPDLDFDTAQVIWNGLESLGTVMKKRHGHLARELEGLGGKRRAMKAYGHLRTHRQGQRIEKDV